MKRSKLAGLGEQKKKRSQDDRQIDVLGVASSSRASHGSVPAIDLVDQGLVTGCDMNRSPFLVDDP